MSEWIIVRNWDRFQHYKDRSPVWIKIYTALRSDPDWLNLSHAEQGLLVNIWLEYARADGVLESRQMYAQSHARRGTRFSLRSRIDSLCKAGWISLSASKPASTPLALARARVREEKKPPTPLRGKPKTTGWREVRGTHGVTHIPDPFGTDRPPHETSRK
jgi:hypothetical protein